MSGSGPSTSTTYPPVMLPPNYGYNVGLYNQVLPGWTGWQPPSYTQAGGQLDYGISPTAQNAMYMAQQWATSAPQQNAAIQGVLGRFMNGQGATAQQTYLPNQADQALNRFLSPSFINPNAQQPYNAQPFNLGFPGSGAGPGGGIFNPPGGGGQGTGIRVPAYGGSQPMGAGGGASGYSGAPNYTPTSVFNPQTMAQSQTPGGMVSQSSSFQSAQPGQAGMQSGMTDGRGAPIPQGFPTGAIPGGTTGPKGPQGGYPIPPGTPTGPGTGYPWDPFPGGTATGPGGTFGQFGGGDSRYFIPNVPPPPFAGYTPQVPQPMNAFGGYTPWRPGRGNLPTGGSDSMTGMPQGPGFAGGGGGQFPGNIPGANPQTQPQTNIYDIYNAGRDVMQQNIHNAVSGAIGETGLTGNRYSSSAQNTAGRIGQEASNVLNQQFQNLLYNQGQADLNRQLQATGMGLEQNRFLHGLQAGNLNQGLDRQLRAAQLGMNFGQTYDQQMQNRIDALMRAGMWETGRADQFGQLGYQDYQNRLYQPLREIAPFVTGSPAQSRDAIVTQNPGSPGAFEYIAALAPIIAAFASDERLKSNVRPIHSLEKYTKPFTPVSWKWKGSGRSDAGFLAQDVERHAPHLVFTEPRTGIKFIDKPRIFEFIASQRAA